jgi:hypothetical protein
MRIRRPLPTAIALDVLVVIVFVAIGRRSHDEGSALSGAAKVAVPFLIGLAVAWGAVRAWHRPLAVLTGVAIWPITVLAGMIGRRWLFDRGTAPAFVVVTTLFLGAFLVGWRALTGRLLRPPGGHGAGAR